MATKDITKIQATGSSLVVKRNDFINTITKFSLMEYRLFNYVAAAIRHNITPDFLTTQKDYIAKIRVADVNQIFEIKNQKNNYQVFKEIAKKLQQKIVEIPTKRGGIATVGIFTKQEYYNGDIFIKIDVDLLPYITNLDKKFVATSLNQAREFSSINAWRLFELCKQWETVGKKIFDVDELKIKIGIEGKYPKISNFEQRVLKPCTEQITDKTPLKITYKKIKTGRRVTHIKFFIGKTLYKSEVKKEIQHMEEQQQNQTEMLKTRTDRKAIWDAMSDEERQKNYPGGSGFIKFMAEFSKIQKS